MLNGFLQLVEKYAVWTKSVLVKLVVLLNAFCRSKIQIFIKVYVSQHYPVSVREISGYSSCNVLFIHDFTVA